MINIKIQNDGLSEKQLLEINNFLDQNKDNINIFNLTKDVDITIIVYRTKESYDQDYQQCSNNQALPWMIGRACHNNIIKIVNFNDYQNTSHITDTLDDYKKMILHEIIHVIHNNYLTTSNKKISNRVLREGLATYLSNQFSNYANLNNVSFEDLINNMVNYKYYYSIVRYMFETMSQKEILEIFKMEDDYTELIRNIYNELTNNLEKRNI